MKDRIKNCIIIFLIIIVGILVYENQKPCYCSDGWMNLYWQKVDENLYLESKLEEIKFQYVE